MNASFVMEKESPVHPVVMSSQDLIGGSLHPRLAWMMCYKETHSVQAVCRKFNISRKTFYKWYKRYQESHGDSKALADRSRRPHHFPRATSEESVALLKQLKEETGFGQRRLRAYLEKKHNIILSERTIWKILKREDQILAAVKA